MATTAPQFASVNRIDSVHIEPPCPPHVLAKFRSFEGEGQQQGNGPVSLGRMNSQDNGVNLGHDPLDTPSPKIEDQIREKVQIPRASTSQSGPASKKYNIPARPKPGRKPIETDPDNKRKLQNRHAQRAFRDRRAVKVQELETKLAELTADTSAKIHDLEMRLNEQMLKNTKLGEDLSAWKLKSTQLEQQLANVQQSQSPPSADEQRYGYPAPTPPEDQDEPMETDFTAMFIRKPAFSTTLDHQMGNSPQDDPCGFCSTPDNCLCRMTSDETAQESKDARQSQILPPISETRVLPSVPLRSAATPRFLEAPTRATGPGQCDMCISDPERAARCRALASSNNFTETRPQPAASAVPSSSDARMSCSDFFTRAQANNVKLGPDVLSRVHVYPYTRQGEPGTSHSPAMEIDAHDAAHALAEMSRGFGPAGDRS